MADAGGGHFYFAASVVEIRDHITSEVGETLDVVARDVTLEVTAPETVRVESMAPFRTEARGSRTLIRVGDLVSGQVVRIVLRVTFPFGEVGREIGALVGVTDRDERLPPGRAGARARRPRVAVRRPPGERRAAAGSRRRSGRGPDLRRPRPAGGRPAQPPGRLRGGPEGAGRRAVRVSLGWVKGHNIKVKALSHTEQFDKKQELVVQIEKVMEECLDQDEIVQYEPNGNGSENVTRDAPGAVAHAGREQRPVAAAAAQGGDHRRHHAGVPAPASSSARRWRTAWPWRSTCWRRSFTTAIRTTAG